MFEEQWDDFYIFLEEMNMSEGTASKLINIYKTFVVQYQIKNERLIEAGGWTKLAVILPLIHSQEDAEKWVGDSCVLTVRDLTKEVREQRSGIAMKDCKHENTFQITCCHDCGDKWKNL